MLLKRDKPIQEEDNHQSLRERHFNAVVDKASDRWPQGGTVDDKWEKLQSAMIDASEEFLGVTKNRQRLVYSQSFAD